MHVRAIMHVVKIVQHLSWRGNIRIIYVGMHVSTHEEKNSDL